MKVEVYRDGRDEEIFCVVYGENITEDDILLHAEDIIEAALEEAQTEKEEDIVLYSDLIIVPRDNGGFYVEFKGFFEE